MAIEKKGRRRRRKLEASFLFVFLLLIIECEACKDTSEKYDLTPISRFVWNVTEKRGSDAIEYRIRICNPLDEPSSCSGSSICAIEGGGDDTNAINVGNFVDRPVVDQDADDEGFWLKFDGVTCPDGENYRTLINFRCGRSLGSPIFIGKYGCSTYFIWETTVACDKASNRKEVPCYVYDSNGNKYDLSSFIKSSGGYFLRTGLPMDDLYINICSEIVPDEATKGCPSGAGACRIIGKEALSFGELDDGLRLMSNGDLRLTYVHESPTFPSGCSDHPRTTVTFVCSKDGMDWNPVILSDSNCDYQIEWKVSTACPLKQLESNDGCRLSSDVDGIKENLHPLRIESGNPYNADGKIGGKMYDFYLSLCGGFQEGFSCNGSSSATVCRKSVDDHIGVVIGTSVNQSLRFADDRMYLSYVGGAPCRPTGPLSKRSQSSVVLFKCGLQSGEPKFVQEEDCVTFFEWETKYACVDRILSSLCYVTDNGNVYDLSSLTRGQEQPWMAIGGESIPMGGSEIYINVCAPVARIGPSVGCPADSAVCVKGADGKMINFGRYTNRPEFDSVTGDVVLNYTSSVSCPSNPKTFITSIVRFVCHPGKLGAAPRVVRSSLDGCRLELEWPTAAACVQGEINGTDCKIQDDDMNIKFDLTPLRRDNGYYNVTVGNNIFFLNVCGGVKRTRCNKDNDLIGACQTYDNTEAFWSLGLATDSLSYYDGLIKLNYVGGMPYKDGIAIERQTNIVFECDRDVGVGYPEYIDDSKYVFNFKWKTSYACMPLPIECVFQNEATQEQFDLSRLSRGSTKEDWEVRESSPRGRNRKFYLNVCRSLTRNDKEAENACASDAAICATQVVNEKEVPFISNLGKAESTPRYEDGQLILRYSSGDVCKESLSGANYTTVIYFHCANYSVPSEDGPGPIFLRNQSCEYVFLWSNQAVCPLRSSQNAHSCSITEPNTGYTFSFNSLKGDFRIPATGSNTFRDFYINFCGRVNESNCSGIPTSNHVSACGHFKGNNSSLALALPVTRRLQISSSGFVTMQFDGPLNATTGKPDYRLEIVFICHRHMNSSRPRFIHQEGDLLVFHYESPLTCPPHGVDCKVHDSRGNSYDLSSLSRGPGHYEVRDPRPGRENVLYHLNVCQPVRSPPFSNCPETHIGACMSDSDSGIGYSLGYVQGKPRPSTGQGTVTIKYLSGSPCNNGTHHRSTRIDFSCSTQHGEPRFVDETAECDYIFSWETPVACPLQQVIGSKCQVVDPRYSSHFNLSKLSKPEGYVVTGSQKTFHINVCNPLSTSCNGQSMAGVCVEENGVKSSGGLVSDQLVYDQGDLSLVYNGGGGGKTSVIKFVCDHTVTGETEGPSFLASVSTDDSFVFLWKTSYACRNYKDTNCKVYGPNGTFYDLSRLTLLDGNYEFIANNGSYKYLINICRSVVHTKDAMCHYGSAVCGVNVTEVNLETKYSNLGEVGSGPFIENGALTLLYDMGELCRLPSSSGFHKKTSIKFECNSRIEEGEPYLLAEDGCNYEFAWSTASACPIQQVENIELGDCTVVNPNTGYHFDLSSLKLSSYVVRTSNGKNLTIGVCDAITNSPCGPDVGSCVQSIGGSSVATNVGKANSHLHYRSETLVLNYTDGEPCGEGSKTTIITFYCGSKGTGLGNPVFADESGCTSYVSWYTELACEQRVHCSVEMDGEVFDLSSLSEQQGHHFAVSSSDDAVYVLNVCRPLNSFAGYKCPLQSAACRIDRSNTSLNLGSVDRPPYVGSEGHIVLDYVNGSQCPQNPSMNISTRVIFMCDDSFTHDVLRMADITPDCTYILEWPTDLVCPTVTHGQASLNCSYYDRRTNKNFNLANLHDLSPSGYKVNFDFEGGGSVFTVAYCGMPSMSDSCSSAAVCLETDGVHSSWGNAASAIYDYDGQVLRVAYKDGDRCSLSQTEKKTSVIYFACDPNAGTGTPELAKSFDCQVVFYWRTSLMCTENTPDCTLLHNGHLYDLRLLSSYSHSWTIDVFPTLEKFWFNVCGQLTGDRNPRCPLDSAICWTMAADKLVSLGSSDSQILTISDDEQSLKLHYSTKTGVCRDGASWISSSTQSVIEFVCSLNANQPQLISRGDKSNNCTFSFKWETPVACPEKRQLEVLELDGKIVDAKLDLTVDLSQILNLKESTVEHRGSDDYLYWISLSGMESYPSESECHGAAICQTKPNNSSFQRNLGLAKDRRFYLQGPQLIVMLTSDRVCDRNEMKNVSTSITLRCSMSAGLGRPAFIYESVDCIYLFDWESEVVCDVEAAHMNNGGDLNRTDTSSSFGSSLGITIVIIVFVLLVIGIVFRNRERRVTVVSRLRGYLRKKPLSTVRYTPLPTNDTNDDDTEATSLLFSTRFNRSQQGSILESDDDEIIEF